MKKSILIFMLFLGILSTILSNSIVYAEEIPIDQDNCNSFYLTEYESGKELYSYNAKNKQEIASMVKIMTLNIIFENIRDGNLNIDDKVLVTKNASSMGGSQMFLEANIEYSVSDLIKGIVVCSANDASVALAEHIGGSHENFVNLMNNKAKEYGMFDTLFANATGLPSQKEQYSTAYDVNIMTRKLMEHDKYYEYASIWNIDYCHPTGRITQMTNTNKLIRRYSYCICGKTGFTDKAGFCLSAGAVKNNLKVVATVLGGDSSDNRFNKIVKLFNYAFSNYSNKEYYKKNECIATIGVLRGKQSSVNAIVNEPIYGLVKNGKEISKVEFKIKENLIAPIKKDDIIGCVQVTTDNIVKRYDIVAEFDIEKLTYLDYLDKILTK